jgi:hypothetical protein
MPSACAIIVYDTGNVDASEGAGEGVEGGQEGEEGGEEGEEQGTDEERRLARMLIGDSVVRRRRLRRSTLAHLLRGGFDGRGGAECRQDKRDIKQQGRQNGSSQTSQTPPADK